ncbi:hypothetical protein KL923_000294 [Ogataea haglerorum]|uniref:Serine/threonine-protein phosphatase n=1 Tax=Ogataea haglerorum TaxID=1937702 RepID=A0ABQ7RN30_9ASCO|nr:hypothetical protein KL923_000294 [Ogataea haglerorum]KAG7769011.1 hypothetical protein KL946_000294 [Ogataea haglerorum]
MVASQTSPQISIHRFDSSSQLENVISQVQHRKTQPAGDPSVYTDDLGHRFCTRDRIIVDVEPPTREVPCNDRAGAADPGNGRRRVAQGAQHGARIGAGDGLRRRAWPILRPVQAVRDLRRSRRDLVPVSRRLRGPRLVLTGVLAAAVRDENKPPGHLLHAPRQPRVRADDVVLHVQGRVSQEAQSGGVREIARVVQGAAAGRADGRPVFLRPRRALAAHAPAARPRHDRPLRGQLPVVGAVLRPDVGRPVERLRHGRGRPRLRRELRARLLVHVLLPSRRDVSPGQRAFERDPRAPGPGLRVPHVQADDSTEVPVHDHALLGAQLLRHVRQQGGGAPLRPVLDEHPAVRVAARAVPAAERAGRVHVVDSVCCRAHVGRAAAAAQHLLRRGAGQRHRRGRDRVQADGARGAAQEDPGDRQGVADVQHAAGRGPEGGAAAHAGGRRGAAEGRAAQRAGRAGPQADVVRPGEARGPAQRGHAPQMSNRWREKKYIEVDRPPPEYFHNLIPVAMSPLQNFKAHENSVKIENALRHVKKRDETAAPSDPTVYVDEHGETFITTERIVKDISPPSFRIPADAEVFPDGKMPDYKFLMQHFKREGRLSEQHLTYILRESAAIFEKEPNMLKVPCPATVVGDIHGQYYDLCKMLNMCGDPAKTQYLFLGDYVDRGDYSMECLILLLAMKMNFPKSFWILRGNHETKRMTEHFTFKRECAVKYSLAVYKEALNTFKMMPFCAVLNEQFFCCHGGLSPELEKLSDISKINRFRYDFPSRGLFSDIMWSDPAPDYDTEALSPTDYDSYFRDNYERHCSYYYSYHAVCHFLEKNNLLSVIRAHQAQDAGYRMYRKNEATGFPSVITLFSAPNYCGTYRNKAAALIYDGSTFNIKQFVATDSPYHLPDFMDVFEWSLPFVSEKVLDILVSILNICTEDELEEETVVARDVVKSLRDVPETSPEATLAAVTGPATGVSPLEARASLRKKLLSIGRMSRMFNILREEAEKVEHLKTYAGGKLPRGVLMDGREELHNRLKSFSEAREADLQNEALPPSAEELERIEEERQRKAREYIDGAGQWPHSA